MYNNMDNYNKILGVFYENPTMKFHVRELARITKLNPNTIINVIKSLEKERLIIKEKKKYIVEISANIENKNFTTKKRIFNLSQIYESGIIEFLEQKYSPKAICVLGSYSKGEDIEKSDIDIIIIGEKEKSEDLTKFEKMLSRKIHLIITDYEKMSKEFYVNLINGIILYGYIDKK